MNVANTLVEKLSNSNSKAVLVFLLLFKYNCVMASFSNTDTKLYPIYVRVSQKVLSENERTITKGVIKDLTADKLYLFPLLKLEKEIVDLDFNREKRLRTVDALKYSIGLTKRFKFILFFDKNKIIIDFLRESEQNRFPLLSIPWVGQSIHSSKLLHSEISDHDDVLVMFNENRVGFTIYHRQKHINECWCYSLSNQLGEGEALYATNLLIFLNFFTKNESNQFTKLVYNYNFCYPAPKANIIFKLIKGTRSVYITTDNIVLRQKSLMSRETYHKIKSIIDANSKHSETIKYSPQKKFCIFCHFVVPFLSLYFLSSIAIFSYNGFRKNNNNT